MLPDNTIIYLMLLLLITSAWMGLAFPHRANVYYLLVLFAVFSIVGPFISDLILNQFERFGGLKNFYYPARIVRSVLLFAWYLQVSRLLRRSDLNSLTGHVLGLGIPHVLFVLLQFLDISGTSQMFREMNTYVGNFSYDQGRNYGLMSGVDSSGIAIALLALMQRCRMKGIAGYAFYLALVSMLSITSRTGIVFWCVAVGVVILFNRDKRWKLFGDVIPVLVAAIGILIFLDEWRSVPWMTNALEPVLNFMDTGELTTVSTTDLANQARFSLPWMNLILGSLIDPTTPTFAGQEGYISDSGFIQMVTAVGWVGMAILGLLLVSMIAATPAGVARGYMLAMVVALLISAVRGPVFFGRFVFDIVIIWSAWFAWTSNRQRTQ